jgi:hypothetical protein
MFARRFIPLLVLTLVSCATLLRLPKSGTHRIRVRDGTELATDVYLPEKFSGKLPTILIRTTYNKDASNKGIKIAAAMAKPFTDKGYAVVVQDTRGRFSSAGVDSIFRTDGVGPNRDGYDTIEWITRQRWSNGRVGMWGFSALGITSYLAAASGHPALVCAYVALCASNVYDDVFYTGGVYRESTVDRWVAGQGRAEFLPFLYANSAYSEYWDAMNLRTHARNAHASIYQFGGWFDMMSQGQTEGFKALQERGGVGARGRQMLVMGPWSHGGMGKQGELEFPKNSLDVNPLNEAVAWFDNRLKGVPNRIDSLPPVRYYLMGDVSDSTAPGNVWTSSQTWPPDGAVPISYYLRGGGPLSLEAPGHAEGTDSYRYDPKDPAPTLGGLNLYSPIGPADMSRVEARPDVLTFSTPPLEEPVTIVGTVRVRLYASSSAPDTDFMGMLCDVYPDGRSILILDGPIRARHRNSFERDEFMTPGEVCEFDINLWDTAIVFNRGHRIRLNVTSSNAPRFQPNPNTATPFHTDTVGVVATNTIYHDATHPSALILPVIPLEE